MQCCNTIHITDITDKPEQESKQEKRKVKFPCIIRNL